MNENKKIRVGVVGVGFLGQHHARVYHSLPEAELVGVADTNTSQGRNISRKYKTKFYPDYRELLSRVDALSIVVPTSLHYEVSMECLKGGVHLLIEKPMVLTPREAKDILAGAGKKNLSIQVGHIERYNTAVQDISRMITQPRFIEVHRLAPFVKRALDVGVVMDLMIHDIDIVLSFVKSAVKKIDAIGANILTSHEDIANVRLQFDNKCVVNMTASRISAARMRKIRIFQPDAYISLDYAKQKFVIYEKKPGVKTPGGLNDIICRKPRRQKKEPLYLELQNFIRSLLHKEKPLVTGADGLEALNIAHRILAAMENPS